MDSLREKNVKVLDIIEFVTGVILMGIKSGTNTMEYPCFLVVVDNKPFLRYVFGRPNKIDYCPEKAIFSYTIEDEGLIAAHLKLFSDSAIFVPNLRLDA